jgi:hypothetical protein
MQDITRMVSLEEQRFYQMQDEESEDGGNFYLTEAFEHWSLPFQIRPLTSTSIYASSCSPRRRPEEIEAPAKVFFAPSRRAANRPCS